ncbi:MAG: response regulator transcription factor [Anaerolineae bacterium]|nr:response regulator transcription factor [Anaerolineae bacterium]
MEEKPIRILIVDDHALVRKGLVALLDVKPGVEVIGEASDGDEAVQMAQLLDPDVILLDLVMPNKDGITALQEIRQHNKDVKVLILTSFTEESKVKAALDAGANGFQLKDSTPAELLTSIQVVHQGSFIAHPKFSKRIFRDLDDDDKPLPASGELTERELAVLQKVALGYTNREIAAMLCISDRTVSTHVSHILSKMDVDNRVKAAMKAMNDGLIVFEEEDED